MREVYLDNSSTTKPCPEAVEKTAEALTACWGNPSSLHTLGFAAERLLAHARGAVARSLGCKPAEIYFTSGGTEANNIALLGAARGRARRGNRVVTTAIEHPSVLSVMKALEKEGFEVVYLMPDRAGLVQEEQVRAAVTERTILVSMMAVNNEVGTLLPIDAAAEAIAAVRAPALLHVDAVQAYGKLPLNPARRGIDLMTVSAHKIHGPKGAGALFIAGGTHLAPPSYGGGQERDMRSGTEPVPAIAGMGAAVEALPPLEKARGHVALLRDRLAALLAAMPEVTVHTPMSEGAALPYILNLSARGARAETMLHFLAERGIYVSTGSACAKGRQSHVLTAMGLEKKEIESALRVSFSWDNTEDDVELFAQALREGLDTLARGR